MSTAKSNKPHQWETGASAWLNSPNGEMCCTVCGVTLLKNHVNADHPTSDPGLPGVTGSSVQTYRDIKGNVFTSIKPLGCPTFMFNAGSAAMENRGHIRDTNEKVEVVEGQVETVEVRVETVEGRLSALEEENGDRLDTLESQNEELWNMLRETHGIATTASRRVEVLAAAKVDDHLGDLPPLLASILREEDKEPEAAEQPEPEQVGAEIIPIRRNG